MARRGTRGFGNADREGTFSGTTLALKPSGVTIDKNAGIVTAGGIPVNFASSGVTVGKIDFGQGTQYKVYRGVAGVSNVGTNDTRLSAGTRQLDTGLTTVSTFVANIGGVTAGAKVMRYLQDMTFILGYRGGSGVTISFARKSGYAGVTPGAASWGGASIYWIAMGT